jgi:hypothetical protein
MSALYCTNCTREIVFTGATAEGFKTDYTHVFGLKRCTPQDSGRPWEDALEADLEVPEPGE